MAKKKPKLPTRGERNIAWIEANCRIPEGKDVGNATKLREWQKNDLKKIYDNPHGTRTAIISYGKKNGKSSLTAWLLLLHLCGPESIENSQLPSTAQSRDQAAIVFSLAAKVVRFSPDLSEAVVIRETSKQLYCPERGTLYMALSADAETAHGKSPIFAIHDELGQVKGPRSTLYTAVENAMSAHEEPMSVIISTQAPTDNDLLSILIDDALAGNDPSIVVSLYTSDPESDAFSEETIRQANPAFGDFQNKKEIMKQAANAKRMPSQEALYRNYTLNQRVEASDPLVTPTVWKSNGGPVDDWGACYGGLDLSETNDLTAFVKVSPRDGVLRVKATFWLPEDGLAERSRRDRVPYDLWHEKGFLNVTPGKSVDYEYVGKYLVDQFQTNDLRRVAFDRFNMRHLRPWLSHHGMSDVSIDERFEDFNQDYSHMSPAIRSLESVLLNGDMLHDNHPVLTMCALNTVVKADESGRRKLNKKRSRGRIDGMVSLCMATAMAVEDMHQEYVYPVPLDSITEDLHI